MRGERMARRWEFRPDKPRSGLLSKLYVTKNQRRSIGKWGLYALALLVISILQDVIFSRLRVYGAATELVPCAIFLICIIEGAQNGSVFTLVAALGYLFSGTAPGVYAIVFIVFTGVGACIFRQAYLQKGFGAALLCTAVAMLAYELLVFAMGLFLGLTVPARILGFLITTGLSLIAVPVLYPIVLAIGSIGGEAWKE
jgi:uncharacterized membrane protein YecN with MAPEG domain